MTQLFEDGIVSSCNEESVAFEMPQALRKSTKAMVSTSIPRWQLRLLRILIMTMLSCSITKPFLVFVKKQYTKPGYHLLWFALMYEV